MSEHTRCVCAVGETKDTEERNMMHARSCPLYHFGEEEVMGYSGRPFFMLKLYMHQIYRKMLEVNLVRVFSPLFFLFFFFLGVLFFSRVRARACMLDNMTLT